MLSGKLLSILALAAGVVCWTPLYAQAAPAPVAAPQTMPKPATNSTADHSKFKELQQTFTSGPEVTWRWTCTGGSAG